MILTSLPSSRASDEQVKNGGFEAGKFTNWTADKYSRVTSGSDVGYYDATSHPPHSGKYSARVGSVSNPGTISQTVNIPSKSKARFTAWYRIEKGSSLTIVLKKGDGSVIQQWTVNGPPSWASQSYDIDVMYAGQALTVEFDGTGYEDVRTTTVICGYDPYTGYAQYCQYETYSDYYPFVDDVSLQSSLAAYETGLSISGLPEGLTTRLYVDGAQFTTLANGQSQPLSFMLGTSHRISVDPYVSKSDTERYYCSADSVTVNSDGSVSFTYRRQYFLSLSSPYGSVTGTGWYDDGSKAPFSIEGTAYAMPGFLGILGARYVFDRWTGDASGSSPSGEVLMDGAKSITASWRADYTVFAIVMVITVGAVAGAMFLLLRRRKGGMPTLKVVSLKAEEEAKKKIEEVPKTVDAEEQEILTLIEKLEKSRAEGRIADRPYLKLKDEYEKRLQETRSRK